MDDVCKVAALLVMFQCRNVIGADLGVFFYVLIFLRLIAFHKQ